MNAGNQPTESGHMTEQQTTQAVFPTGTWVVDTSATTVTVTVRKMGFLTVPANLTVTSGTIEVGENGQIVKVDVAVDASSYKSKNAKRNEHVTGSDFLDADQHPVITFRAGAVTATADGHRASGTVTIKGQTSPVDVAVSDVEFTDANGSFTAAATVDRKTAGVDKLPAFIIGRTLDLMVTATVERSA